MLNQTGKTAEPPQNISDWITQQGIPNLQKQNSLMELGYKAQPFIKKGVPIAAAGGLLIPLIKSLFGVGPKTGWEQ